MKYFPCVIWREFFFCSLLSRFHIRPLSRVSGSKSILSPSVFVILRPEPRHYPHPGQHGRLHPACHEPRWIQVHLDNRNDTPNAAHIPSSHSFETNKPPKKREREKKIRVNRTQDLFLFFSGPRTECGGRTARSAGAAAASGLTSTETLTLAGAVSFSQPTICPMMQTCLKCRHSC